MTQDKKFFQTHFFKLDRYRVSADKLSADEPETNEAVVKITVPAKEAEGKIDRKFRAEIQPDNKKFLALTATSHGDGTVDALDRALRRLLEPIYPFMKSIRLIRYEVQSTQRREGTSSKVEVFILAANKDGKLYFSEVASVSVIEASFSALANIYNRFYVDEYCGAEE